MDRIRRQSARRTRSGVILLPRLFRLRRNRCCDNGKVLELGVRQQVCCRLMLSAATIRLLLYAFISGLQALLLGTLTLRRLYRTFPVFYAYTAFEVFRGTALYWILYLVQVQRTPYRTYFQAYWGTEILAVVLCFVLVYRIFDGVFHPFGKLRKIGTGLFLAGALLSLTLAVVTAASAPGTDPYPLVGAAMLLQRSVAVVRCGLLLLLFVSSSSLALSWRSQPLGIALGLGVWSASELATLALRTHVGPIGNGMLRWMTAAGYLFAVVVWFIYFLLPHADAQPWREAPREKVREWNTAVTELLSR